ncbi:MAG: FtsH protease activity modulator HflK [Gammaproteobacteria bacterium]|nr:FtsH protease activity modulator HflK [Gammaproteobacteria bacterium]
MAWNEPGNSGDKDPWGQNKGDQGPPDLDEVVKKLQQKFASLFGGGSGASKGGSGGSSSGSGFAVSGSVIAILGLIAWGLSGLYIIEEGYRGVVLRLGAYEQSTGPGLHWYPRFIDTVAKVDVSGVRSAKLGYQSDEALMLTQDENIIDIRFDVQYQVKNDPDAARDYLFNVRNPDETLRQATASAVREVIGKSKMDFVITEGRGVVTIEAQNQLQQTLDLYRTGLMVTNFTMQNAQAPLQVKQAFDDVVEAREDSVRYVNEAETYSNDILPKARGLSARTISEAEAYRAEVVADAEGRTDRFLKVLAEYEKAPEVTRKRLYLDSMESVLSKSGKVVIDVEGGNNMLYLPLDRLRSDAATGRVAAPRAESTSSANSSSSVSQRIRDSIRRREVR